MTTQQLHDTWLIVTVIATLGIGGIAIFLCWTFRNSTRKRFFFSLGAVLAAVAVDQATQEVKNLVNPPPIELTTAWAWVVGRTLVAIVASIGLVYMVFGRNGGTPTAPPPEETP